MVDRKDQRNEPRRATDAPVTVTVMQGRTTTTVHGRGVDISASGICVQSHEALDPETRISVQCERFGLAGAGAVRHCTRRGPAFLIGIEFNAETRSTFKLPASDFTDYYELLQISPRAETETVHRVFRMMAARFHPDNPRTGDPERFLMLRKALEVLGDPTRRAEYDVQHRMRGAEPLPVFEMPDFVFGIEGENNRRLGILCLLYNQRRSNADRPSLSLLDLETLMSFPREHLAFTIWYLREKNLVRLQENTTFAITAEGIDYVEKTSANRIVNKLLREAEKHPDNAETAESRR